MSRLFFSIVFQVLILSGCNRPKTLISDLEYREFRYYKKGSSQQYTGTAITNFDDGNLSNSIEIKNGIPNGKWASYGYMGEVIQEGSYSPVNMSDDSFLVAKSVHRLNICFGKEGSYSSTDIDVIVDVAGFTDTSSIKRYIVGFVKQKNILTLQSDTEIKFMGGELK
jgi:hypothetical protein